MERLSWFTSERCSIRHRSHHVTTIASHSCSTPLIKLHFSRLRFRSMTRSVMRLSAIRQLALACWKSVLIFPRFLCAGVGGNETISDYLSEWNEEKTKKKGHNFVNQRKKAENWIILFSCAALSTHRHQQQKREKFFPSSVPSSERFFVSEFNQFSRGFFFVCLIIGKNKTRKSFAWMKDSRNVVI